MTILIVTFGLLSFGLMVGVIWLINQLNKNKDKLIQIENKKLELETKISIQENKKIEIETRLNEKIDELNRVKDELLNSETKRLTEQGLNNECAAKLDYRGQIEAQIEEMAKLLAAKNEEMAKLTSNADQIAADMNEKLLKIESLEAEIRALEGRRVSGQEVLERNKVELNNVVGLLNEKLVLARAVLNERSEDCRWELMPGEKELKLIRTLNEIVGIYPDLTVELQGVAWKKVWLPLIQGLVSREGLDGKGGIYKISLKSDPGVCYIGQAVNIKDRWYTHIKKMIGAMAKGGERLYEYKPDEVWWEVIEEKGGNLDEDEKYWIDYYCCKEIGLNKKR